MAAPQQTDDFNIPPPSDNGNAPAPETNSRDGQRLQYLDGSAPPILNTVGRTELILGAAAILGLAALLLFLRNAIRRSLIANRATIDSAGAAAWTWYFALLDHWRDGDLGDYRRAVRRHDLRPRHPWRGRGRPAVRDRHAWQGEALGLSG